MLIPRFTTIALMSVALLLLTGTFQAAVQLHFLSATFNDAVNALITSAYGRAFEVALTDQHDQPIQKTDAVLLRFVMLDMDMGEQELRLDPVQNNPGHYHAIADTLSMAGHWQIFLLVRRPGFEDVRISLTYTLPP